MKLIQISNTYRGDVLDIVRGCVPDGFEIRTLPDNTVEALISCISDADYLLASGRVRIDASVLEHAGNLRMIQRTGVGLDSLDLAAIEGAGIPLYINPGINSESVAEHALLLILACLRNLPELNANTKRGIWRKQEQGIRTRELSGKSVGIIGMGHIGRILARILKSFDAHVVYNDAVRLSSEAEEDLGVCWAGIDDLLASSDIISLHCPLLESTRHLIRKETISQMRDGVILVNTARGGLVCEEDLLSALNDGKVYAAGLDVFEQEPVAADNPLLSNDHVITTPHIGGVTFDSFTAMMLDAMRNIAAFDAGDYECIEPYRYTR